MEELVKAYSQAIEYYQSIESDLFADMTVRMQQFLIKPEILTLMASEEEEELDELDLIESIPEPQLEPTLSAKLRKFCKIPTPMNVNQAMRKFEFKGS